MVLKMCLFRGIVFVFVLSDIQLCLGFSEAVHHSHSLHVHKPRRHRATNDAGIRFEPAPYSKKLELNSSGKIHCKVAGGVAPTIQWFLNDEDPLPDGVSSANGTLMVTEASRKHAGNYTCRATDGNHSITAKITLDIVVSPRVVEPNPGQQIHVTVGQNVSLNCVATGDPPPTTHWDKNATVLHQQDGVDIENAPNRTLSRLEVLGNGSLLILNASEADSGRYGCTAGSPAGLDREELLLVVHPEGELLPHEAGGSGVAGKAVLVSVSVAGAYMLLVLALMLYCRRRRRARRERGEKEELEMCEGREKLVEETEDGKVKTNSAPIQNGRLLSHDKDSGADNSEVSGISRASKRSGQYDQLSIPRSMLSEQITLGRGEFGDVMIAKVDMAQLRKLKNKEDQDSEPQMRPVLVKFLTTKDEVQLAEFRRQLELFRGARHEHLARLLGLCNEMEPHAMLLEHTDWGDLKSFLIATRTSEENEEYIARVGPAHGLPPLDSSAPPLALQHRLLLAQQLAAACNKLAGRRLTHRDIAARNCAITSKLQLKLSFPALTRGPHSHEYHKLHDQVIPLRWLPYEAVMEGEYSTKSDVYMYAVTIWEIYTKAEMPFAKLNDNSVLERLKTSSLEWNTPNSMPERLATLLKRCWNKSPTDRPQFADICEELAGLIIDATSENASQHSHDKIEQV